MSKDDITLTAKKRNLIGKQVRQLRDQGSIPAVVHQRGEDSQNVAVDSLELKKVFNQAGKHHAVKLDIEGKRLTTIIKEVTQAPASNKYHHVVFQAIKDDEKVTAEIPIKLSEDIPAERASLLVLKDIEHVVVEAFPKDLVDSIEVDASSLESDGDKLLVSDIKLSGDITIKTEPDTVIVHVETPKDQIAEADAALEETAAQEGVVESEAPSEEATSEDNSSETDQDSENK